MSDSTEGKIDIRGIVKEDLMKMLWEDAKVAGFFMVTGRPSPEWNGDKDTWDLNEKGFADYVHGRVIKTNIYEDFVDPWLYDRDNGEGKFEQIVHKYWELKNDK